MKYELELFSRIIEGDLSPVKINDFNKPIDYLQAHNKQCVKYFNAKFYKKSEDEFILKSYSEHKYIDLKNTKAESEYLGGKNLLDSLVTQLLNTLNLQEANLIQASFNFYPDDIYLDIKITTGYENLSPEEARFQYYNKLMREEIERIRNAFNQEVFSNQSEKKIRGYIHKHQEALKILSQIVYAQFSKRDRMRIFDISKAYTVTDIYKKAFMYLDLLLSHIENNYKIYLNINSEISYMRRIIIVTETQRKLKEIKAALIKRNISKPLISIVCEPCNKLIRLTENDRFTYQDLIYHKNFQNELYRLLACEEDVSDNLIVMVLYSLNYNAPKFYNFIINGIKQELEHKGDKDKLHLLYYHIKNFNQLQVTIKLSYNTKLPTLKQQVLTWLFEEVNFLEKKVQNRIFDQNIRSKLTTKMSVAQLSYFARVMSETGILVNKNNRNIFRFLSDNLTTKKQENISDTSISVKYYNVEDNTKLAVKDMLTKMLSHINKTE